MQDCMRFQSFCRRSSSSKSREKENSVLQKSPNSDLCYLAKWCRKPNRKIHKKFIDIALSKRYNLSKEKLRRDVFSSRLSRMLFFEKTLSFLNAKAGEAIETFYEKHTQSAALRDAACFCGILRRQLYADGNRRRYGRDRIRNAGINGNGNDGAGSTGRAGST